MRSTIGLLPLLATLATRTEPTDKLATAPPQAKALPTAPLAATYTGEYKWGDDTRKEAGGTLSVYPELDSTVLLALDVSNGPPAFHLGNMYWRVVMRRGVERCAFKEADYMLNCRLRLASP
jgi:hypothetical protein